MIAASSGQVNIIYVGGVDPATGEAYVGYIAVPWAGGMGARPDQDGLDVIETDLTNAMNYPTEAAEADLPMRLRWVRLGRIRAGPAGSVAAWGTRPRSSGCRGEATLSRATATATVTGPWGLFGGQAAPPAGRS